MPTSPVGQLWSAWDGPRPKPTGFSNPSTKRCAFRQDGESATAQHDIAYRRLGLAGPEKSPPDRVDLDGLARTVSCRGGRTVESVRRLRQRHVNREFGDIDRGDFADSTGNLPRAAAIEVEEPDAPGDRG